MSRSDYSADLAAALDQFDVPAPRAGLAERIVAAAAIPQVRTQPRRDRRGGWKLTRRVIIGTVAAGALSAAAVASGLLGAAGIRVPVLTAMLAPDEPAPKPKAVVVSKPPVRMAEKPVIPVVDAEAPALADPGSIALPIDAGARLAVRAERRAERRAFIQANPQIVPGLRQALSREVQFVRDNPDVRALRRIPPGPERRAFLAERPELQSALRARQQDRRAFLAENPEIVTHLREQSVKRRVARTNREPANEIVLEAEGNAIDAR